MKNESIYRDYMIDIVSFEGQKTIFLSIKDGKGVPHTVQHLNDSVDDALKKAHKIIDQEHNRDWSIKVAIVLLLLATGPLLMQLVGV